ncbi:MAG: ABC transporter permease [Alphaproteobacteria bacterium]|nr:ABC transporter permease [Alphaproteobacteria bacterium]
MSSTAASETATRPAVQMSAGEGGALRLAFSGDWKMTASGAEALVDLRTRAASAQKLSIDLTNVGAWDTSLVALLFSLTRHLKGGAEACEWQGVPQGVEGLLRLASAQKREKATEAPDVPLVEKMGEWTLELYAAGGRVATFVGDMTLAAGRMLRGKAYFRRVDFVEALADAGPRALPIVTLISFLVGLILAFVGSMQLQQFGAQIFVANLVGVAMTREMGAMMTGIIMAGRTGASYAARLGTMQVNEEIDALRTNGMEPLDFLALPRVLALLLMVPVLCVYADAVGILGGAAIGVGMLDLSPTEYWNQTVKATRLVDCWAGLIKSVVFALVVGLAGCYHGFRCGRSSEAVGRVTTTAVVSAIVFIILTDALLTVVYDVLGF